MLLTLDDYYSSIDITCMLCKYDIIAGNDKLCIFEDDLKVCSDFNDRMEAGL